MTLNVLHADAAEIVCHEVGGLLNVGFVFIERAYAGDAKEIF